MSFYRTLGLGLTLGLLCLVAPACDSDDPPSTPPGFCRASADCGDAVCRTPAGECGGLGQCVERPAACPAVLDPVCGCDGQTYGNECEALSAGVSVASQGEC